MTLKEGYYWLRATGTKDYWFIGRWMGTDAWKIDGRWFSYSGAPKEMPFDKVGPRIPTPDEIAEANSPANLHKKAIEEGHTWDG